MLEWILAVGGEESTYDDFNDLMVQTHRAKTATGGLTGITAFEIRSTGLANYKNAAMVDVNIESDDALTNQNLLNLQEKYGRENLDKMSPQELYKLYAKFVAGHA